MTRFRDLPGGIDRTNYSRPHISAIHPEHGVYEMDVHWTVVTIGSFPKR